MLDTGITAMILGDAEITINSPRKELVVHQSAACQNTLEALIKAWEASKALLDADGGSTHPMTRGIERLIAHCQEGLRRYEEITADNDLPF